MHEDCARMAYEELAGDPARDPVRFANRQDEYLEMIQEKGG